MKGFQKLFGMIAYGTVRAMASSYYELSEDEKLRLNQLAAERMANKAFSGKLDYPYNEDEIDFIREFYQRRE